MFNRIRQIHLLAAFILTAFVLMYFVSGFVMIFEETFQRKDISLKTEKVMIPGIRSLGENSMVSALMSAVNVRGQYQVRINGNRTHIHFRHPGVESSVMITEDSDTVQVTTKKKNVIAALHQFHRLHGYHGGWKYLAWAFVYDLSALSMILFALTGVYMWYKTERVKWPGWLILLGFTALTAFTFVYLRFLQ